MKQKQKRSKKNNLKKSTEFAAEQQARGQASEPASAQQLGATEDDVQPLTPPTADTPSKPAPVARKRYAQDAEDVIDPADELTPG